MGTTDNDKQFNFSLDDYASRNDSNGSQSFIKAKTTKRAQAAFALTTVAKIVFAETIQKNVQTDKIAQTILQSFDLDKIDLASLDMVLNSQVHQQLLGDYDHTQVRLITTEVIRQDVMQQVDKDIDGPKNSYAPKIETVKLPEQQGIDPEQLAKQEVGSTDKQTVNEEGTPEEEILPGEAEGKKELAEGETEIDTDSLKVPEDNQASQQPLEQQPNAEPSPFDRLVEKFKEYLPDTFHGRNEHDFKELADQQVDPDLRDQFATDEERSPGEYAPRLAESKNSEPSDPNGLNPETPTNTPNHTPKNLDPYQTTDTPSNGPNSFNPHQPIEPVGDPTTGKQPTNMSENGNQNFNGTHDDAGEFFNESFTQPGMENPHTPGEVPNNQNGIFPDAVDDFRGEVTNHQFNSLPSDSQGISVEGFEKDFVEQTQHHEESRETFTDENIRVDAEVDQRSPQDQANQREKADAKINMPNEELLRYQEQINKLNEKIAKQEAKLDNAIEKLEKNYSDIEKQQSKLEKAETDLEKARHKLDKLESSIDKDINKITKKEKNAEKAEEKIQEKLAEEIQKVELQREKVAEQELKIEKTIDKLAKEENDIPKQEAKIAKIEAKLDNLRSDLSELEQAFEQHANELLENAGPETTSIVNKDIETANTSASQETKQPGNQANSKEQGANATPQELADALNPQADQGRKADAQQGSSVLPMLMMLVATGSVGFGTTASASDGGSSGGSIDFGELTQGSTNLLLDSNVVLTQGDTGETGGANYEAANVVTPGAIQPTGNNQPPAGDPIVDDSIANITSGGGATLGGNNTGNHQVLGSGTETASGNLPPDGTTQNETETEGEGETETEPENEIETKPAPPPMPDPEPPVIELAPTPPPDTTPPGSPTVSAQSVSDATPTLTGTAEAGATVDVTVNGNTYTTTADGDGNWSVDVTDALGDNTYDVTVQATDNSGNESPETTYNNVLTIDTTTAAPTLNSLSTMDATPTLTGTAEAGATVEVTVNGNTYTTTADGNGDWSVEVTDNLTDNTYNVTVNSTDTLGNASGNVNFNNVLLVDTTTAAPTLNGLTPTADNTPSLSGTAEAGATIEVTVNGNTYTTTADGNGDWSVDVTDALPDNTYDVVVKATDALGNESRDINFNNVLTVDTTTAAPTLNALSTTADTTPDISGTAEAGATVSVTINGNTYNTTADGNGDWSITVPGGDALGEGTYDVTVNATDTLGNTSGNVTFNNALTIDTSTPAPTLNALSTTADTTPDISGTAEAGATIAVTVNDNTYITTADGNGDWSITVPGADALGDGTYTITVSATDTLGNTSGDATFNDALTIDTTTPAPTLDAMSATADTTPDISGSAEANADITVTINGETYNTTADGNGDWSITIPGADALGEGTYDVTVRATDGIGNTSGDVTYNDVLTIDTSTDAPTLASLDPTQDTTPELSGTAEAGATISVTINGETYITTADGNGDWSVTVPGVDALADGNYDVTVNATDTLGNSSGNVTFNDAVTIDTSTPAPTVDGLTTNDDTPTVTGTAEAGATVAVTINGTTYNTTANGSGNWSITTSTIPVGTYTVLVNVTDTAGNTNQTTATDAVTVNANYSYEETQLTSGLAGNVTIYGGDIDNDGDIDIYVVDETGQDVYWLENNNGSWDKHTIDSNYDGYTSAFAADLDNDGNIDLLVGDVDPSTSSSTTVEAFFNPGSPENETTSNWYDNWMGLNASKGSDTRGEEVKAVFAADVDQGQDASGDIEVVALTDSTLAVFAMSSGSKGTKYKEAVIDTVSNGTDVLAADIDGAGNLDLVASSTSEGIKWWSFDLTYSKKGGLKDATNVQEHTIDANISANALFAADVDDDNDIDIFAISEDSDELVMYENTSGDGSSWSKQVIAEVTDPKALYAYDVDQDGDLDLVVALNNDSDDEADIMWFENVDTGDPGTGDGSEWVAHEVTSTFNGANDVYVMTDSDGNVQIVGANDDEVVAWEVTGG